MDKYSLEAREGQLRFWYSCTAKNPHDGRGACLEGQAPPESPWKGAVDSPDTLYLPQVCSWERMPPSQHDGLTSHHPSSLPGNIAVKRYRQHVPFLVPPQWNSSTHPRLSSLLPQRDHTCPGREAFLLLPGELHSGSATSRRWALHHSPAGTQVFQ